jgi:hypothetical protein
MTQNIADDFDVGTIVDLPTGVAVAKRMSPNHIGNNTSAASVKAYAMPDGTARERIVRYHRA